MDYLGLDDESLIRLISHADSEALGTLYERYKRLVFGMAIHATGDYPSAEEITQDVFVRVWERARQYRADQGKVSTWLASIARYRAIDVLRRRGVRPEHHSIAWADLAPGSEPAADGPDNEVQLSLDRQRVRAALAELPAEQREAIALAYFKGYSQSQIATALGQPLGTVKTRIRLGMQKLRQSLQTAAGR